MHRNALDTGIFYIFHLKHHGVPTESTETKNSSSSKDVKTPDFNRREIDRGSSLPHDARGSPGCRQVEPEAGFPYE